MRRLADSDKIEHVEAEPICLSCNRSFTSHELGETVEQLFDETRREKPLNGEGS